MKSQLDPEGLKNAVNEEMDQIKREPLNKGDTWERMKTANFGRAGDGLQKPIHLRGHHRA